MKPARDLTIAGSDSSGGAGIQADLKTITVLGGFGMSVITALTAQNTLGVQGVYEVTPDFVQKQFESVMTDVGVDAAKTGMLANAAVLRIVAENIRKYNIEKLVVDPVMVAKGGALLIRGEFDGHDRGGKLRLLRIHEGQVVEDVADRDDKLGPLLYPHAGDPDEHPGRTGVSSTRC
jgi:hypothetical protein